MRLALILFLMVSPVMVSGVTISSNIKGTTSQVARLQKIIKVVEKIINSGEFAKKVSGSTYKDYYAKGGDVIRKIKASNWELDLSVERHCEDKICDNLGWTYPNKKTIYFNDRGYTKSDKSKFDERSDSGIAGTICHEKMHKLGYDHKKASSLNSVPYSLGTLCALLYGKYEKE